MLLGHKQAADDTAALLCVVYVSVCNDTYVYDFCVHLSYKQYR